MRKLLKHSKAVVALAQAIRSVPRDLQTALAASRAKRDIARYLASHQIRKLHIGCGKNILAGWLNTDLEPRNSDAVRLDATGRFPFADATFDYIFSEHIIEHLTFRDGQRMLAESFRILRPGGKIRIATPNLLQIARLVTEPSAEDVRQYIETASHRYITDNTARLPGFVVNNFFWDFGHYFVYDPDTLKFALEKAGFSGVAPQTSRTSSDAHLSDLEMHGSVVAPELNAYETIIFEATKPQP